MKFKSKKNQTHTIFTFTIHHADLLNVQVILYVFLVNKKRPYFMRESRGGWLPFNHYINKRPTGHLAHLSNNRHDKTSLTESLYKISTQCSIINVDPV